MDRSHLVLEYQALVNETKRKFPDVKDAAERAITTSRNASLDLRKDGRHSDELLAPIELGCRTKVPKVVATSIGALQRLVGVGALTERLVPAALSMLGDAISAGLDSQLKILQVLLFILKYCQGIHGDVLSQLLLLCFRLHDSKVGIVSSTAAATLRQAVMMVFERLSVEAGPNGTATNDVLAEDANGPAGLSESVIQALSPDVSDAFWIFQDLCTLLSPPEVRKHQKQQSLSSRKVAHGGTVILQLRDLSKTFGLELIESILNGFSKEILQRLELLAVLRSSLCSLLAQSVQHTLDFAVTLRLIRLQYLVVRSYASRLPLETEVFLNTFISFALGENNAGRRPSVAVEGTPYWLRVMCMEALLGLFQSAKLTEHVWVTYDALDGHSDLLTKFIDALNRILSERPGQLGTSAEMHGLHVGALSSPSQTFSPTKEETYLDKGISVMTSAATMGVNTVSAIMSGDQTEGLDASACAMKVQCIEQHDKAEPPTIPEKNLYLLAVKAFNRIVSNVAGSQLISKSVVSACWTAFLATYSLLLKANISIDLYHETLDSLRDLMVVIGEVDLQTPKEAFYTALGRLALPASLINAAQQYQEHGQKPALTTAADALGLGATAPARRPSMSERNVACLQVIFDVIERTQDGIKDSWLRLLPVLEDANYILQPASRRSAPSGTPEMPSSPRIQRMSSYATHDSENIITSIASDRLQGIFSQTSSLSEISLRALVQAICNNNAELIKGRAGPEAATPTTPITPRADRSFDLTRAMTKGERAYRAHKSQYCVTLLDKVANTNLERFVADDELWRTITNHLFFIASHPDLSLESRVQAVQALLHMVQETLNRNEEPPAGEALTTQARALATLLRLVKADQDTNLDAELRAISLERLNSILEFAGHTLVDAWSVIFVALRTTCKENRSRAAPSLVRTAFVALNLICSDFASTLRDWPSCISCLSAFGSQHIDVNVSLSAIGLMWQMSDHLRNAPQGTASTELLVSLSKLCTDDRAEVRLSALQTLFRCISTLSVSDGVDDIILALLEDFDSKAAQGGNHAEWDETGSTILGEIGALIAAGDCLKDSEHAERVTALTSTWACKPGTKLCTASLELEARLDSAKSTAFERVSTLLKTQAEDSTLDQAKPGPFFTQDNLKALIGLLRRRATHDVASALDCAVLAVQYRLSPTYVTDVDALSPLQQAVLDLWVEVNAGSGLRLAVADRLLRLAFESRFRFVDITMRFGPSSKTTLKDVTFVALHKALLPKVQQLVLSEEKLLLDKSDEVLLGFIQTLMLPLKLGKACPPANKYGDDAELPFSSRSVLTEVLSVLLANTTAGNISDERRDQVWRMALEAVKTLLPDASASEKGKERAVPTSADQDTALADLLRDTILPRLVSADIPPEVIEGFAASFQQASVLWIHRGRPQWDLSNCAPRPTVAPADRLAGESIRLRCLDLLFAGVSQGQVDDRVRKTLNTVLEARARSSLTSMLADLSIRGSKPFERIREMDMIALLQRIEQGSDLQWTWLPPLLLQLATFRQEASLPRLSFSPQDPLLQALPAVDTGTSFEPSSHSHAAKSLQDDGSGEVSEATGGVQSGKDQPRIALQAKELAVRILGRMTGSVGM